jgi:two-component system response regulator FlrC
MILSGDAVIGAAHIRFEGVDEPLAAPLVAAVVEIQGRALHGSLRAAEKQILLTALQAGRSRSEVAATLGISPRTLRYKIARLRSAGAAVPAA